MEEANVAGTTYGLFAWFVFSYAQHGDQPRALKFYPDRPAVLA